MILLVAPVLLFFIHSRAAEMDLLPLPSGATNSLHDWETIYRPASLKRMQEVMGPLPEHDRSRPLNVEVKEEMDCGEYVRRLITYEPEPNSTVPAYLLIPKRILEEKGSTHGILTSFSLRRRARSGRRVGNAASTRPATVAAPGIAYSTSARTRALAMSCWTRVPPM